MSAQRKRSMNNTLRDPFNLRRNLNGAPAAASALTQFNLLRATATQVATEVTERVTETAADAIERGKQAVEDLNQNIREQRERAKEKKDDDYHHHDDTRDREAQAETEKDMSFTIPKNVPSFSNPQRELEDRVWGASGVTARSTRGGGGTGGGIVGEGLVKVGDFLNPNRASLPMYKDKPYGYLKSSRHRPIYRRKRFMAWVLIMVVAVAWWLGLFGKDGYERLPSLRTSDWLQKEGDGSQVNVDWLQRRDRVVEAFELSWDSYERYGWGMFYLPLTHVHEGLCG